MNSQATNPANVNMLIADLQSGDDAVRGAAWQGAATFGSAAVKPLANLMTHGNFEIARSAKRALWRIVRHAGRPKATKERKTLQVELISLLQAAPVAVRCESAWMLSEIGDSRAVAALASLLTEASVSEFQGGSCVGKSARDRSGRFPTRPGELLARARPQSRRLSHPETRADETDHRWREILKAGTRLSQPQRFEMRVCCDGEQSRSDLERGESDSH